MTMRVRLFAWLLLCCAAWRSINRGDVDNVFVQQAQVHGYAYGLPIGLACGAYQYRFGAALLSLYGRGSNVI